MWSVQYAAGYCEYFFLICVCFCDDKKCALLDNGEFGFIPPVASLYEEIREASFNTWLRIGHTRFMGCAVHGQAAYTAVACSSVVIRAIVQGRCL